jgi:hypothetical protein
VSSGVRATIASLIVGVVASLIAAFAVELETSKRIPLGTALAFMVAAAAVYALVLVGSARFRAAFGSSIRGYYPRGQSSYARRLIRDLGKSRSIVVVGARGRDLIGESSEIGQQLDKWNGTMHVYLLSPSSDHARLRTGHLEVERDKYTAEAASVQAFLNVVSLHNHLSVTLTTYDADPVIRAIILDRVAYLAPYIPHVQGRRLPTYRVTRKDPTVETVIEGILAYLSRAEVGVAVQLEQSTSDPRAEA